MRRRLAGLLALGASAAPGAGCASDPAPRAELRAAPRTALDESLLVYRADLAEARARGDVSRGEDDAAVLDEIRASVAARLRGLEATEGARVGTSPRGEVFVALPGALDTGTVRRVRERLATGDLLQIALVAREGDGDLERERSALASWRALHPGAPLAHYRSLAFEDGGPHPRFFWVPVFLPPGIERRAGWTDAALLWRGPPEERWVFTGRDLESVTAVRDALGEPSASFRFRDGRGADFEGMTRAHVGRRLALVIGGELRLQPRIRGPVGGSGVLFGEVSPERLLQVVRMLQASIRLGRSAPLRAPLELVEIRPANGTPQEG